MPREKFYILISTIILIILSFACLLHLMQNFIYSKSSYELRETRNAPHYAVVYNQIDQHISRGELNKALEICQVLVDYLHERNITEPQFLSSIYSKMAHIYFKLNLPKEVHYHLEKSLKLNPNNSEAEILFKRLSHYE